MTGRDCLALLLALPLSAAYQNLIATQNGNTVYFSAPTGISQSTWFVSTTVTGTAAFGVTSGSLSSSLADIDSLGTVVAYSSNLLRRCDAGISGCILAASCKAEFLIQGKGISWTSSNRLNFVRLNRKGNIAWIEQTDSCNDFTMQPLPALSGLYGVVSRQQIAPSAGAQLANRRIGRRAVTDDGRALVFMANRLNWLDSTGLSPIPQQASAFEAVSDAAGNNIVYNETDGGILHWISAAQDRALGIAGSMPAVTDDGKALIFLDQAHVLQFYDLNSGVAQPLSPGEFDTFTTSGTFVFAATTAGQLLRIDLVSATQIVWLQPSPEIDSFRANIGGQMCPFPCYGPQEPGYVLSPGMIVVLQGKALNRSGLVATLRGSQTSVIPLSGTSAYFRVPQQVPAEASPFYFSDDNTLVVRDQFALVPFQTKVLVAQQSVTCLAAVHQDFASPVTAENPAVSGETVHVFLTGLRSAEALPDGVPNPTDRLVSIPVPSGLVDPAAVELLFFGLAPGQIGLDELDLRVKASSYSGCSAFH